MNVRWMGRTYEQDGIHWFNWTNAGFEFRFRGTGAVAKLHASIKGTTPAAQTYPYIKIYVDGAYTHTVQMDFDEALVPLARGLEQGEHTVRVVKRTGGRASTSGVSTLTVEDGELLPPPKAPTRKMLFIGDSLTVGYGTLGDETTTEWSTETEDGTNTYTALTADCFGAENHTVAVSGRGVVRNYDGTTDLLMSQIMNWTDYHNRTPWDASRYQPDVIVVNLGTNDASSHNSDLTAAEFKAGCTAMLRDIRAHYPNAKIIYAYEFANLKWSAEIAQCVAELHDPALFYLKLRKAEKNERAIGHPNAWAHAECAKELIEAVQAVTGWQPIQ